jgi:hypothetical protein
LSSYKKGDSDNPSPTAEVLVALGRAHTHLKQYAEAETYLLQSYRLLEGQQTDKVAMQATLKALNLLYEAWGRPSEAASFRKVLAEKQP